MHLAHSTLQNGAPSPNFLRRLQGTVTSMQLPVQPQSFDQRKRVDRDSSRLRTHYRKTPSLSRKRPKMTQRNGRLTFQRRWSPLQYVAMCLFAALALSGPLAFSFTTNSRTRAWTFTSNNPVTIFATTSSPPEKPNVPRRGWKKRQAFAIHKLPKAAYRIYVGYIKRLWKETDFTARKEVAKNKVQVAIRNVQHMMDCEEYSAHTKKVAESQMNLQHACNEMLLALKEEQEQEKIRVDGLDQTAADNRADANQGAAKKPRSIMFGVLMGAAVACWVFSGNYVFTTLFTLMTILGQLEYYRMIMNTGVYPARRISVIGAASMFVTALFAPELHQICLPMFGLWAMIWFLTMRKSYTTIPEIASTFTGMFYLGYVPSFWVRVRLLGADMAPTRLNNLLDPLRMYLKTKFDVFIPEGLIQFPITAGAVFIFWSWLSLAFSDVGAYFVGRRFGKTKLGAISPAAGATSPNKTVEGVIGGCLTSALLSIFGAWVQKWPYFVITGSIHGLCLGMLGLIGDLTASMLKRDAGIKDFGDLIPEHGGILDRVDSFVWSAPYSWLVCGFILPALRAMAAR